jgi:hypothetical protein
LKRSKLMPFEYRGIRDEDDEQEQQETGGTP